MLQKKFSNATKKKKVTKLNPPSTKKKNRKCALKEIEYNSIKHSSFYSRKEMEKILKRRSKTICKSHQMFGSLETAGEKKNDP